MQVRDIVSGLNGENLGSVLYSQTLMMVDENSVHINITKNIPNLQHWISDTKHYESLPIEINTAKILECEILGEKNRNDRVGAVYQSIYGILPVCENLKDIFRDFVLLGKIVFFEKGFMFIDQRFHGFILPYHHFKQITLYQTQQYWLELEFEDNYLEEARRLQPCNLVSANKFYLKVNQQFFKEKFAELEKILMVDKDNHISKMKNVYEECPIVKQSLAWQNYLENKKFNETFNTDFLSVSYDISRYEEYMEFLALHEFNKVRGKEFIAFQNFSKVYKEANQDALMPDSRT